MQLDLPDRLLRLPPQASANATRSITALPGWSHAAARSPTGELAPGSGGATAAAPSRAVHL
ncbi:MAG: hypothetical protein WD073_10665 [Xanthobacteraceae bacterium]